MNLRQYPADRIRNVGLFGHGGAGKTSLAEALLFDTKATTRLGRVDEGNTVTDYDPDEIKRHISVSAALAPSNGGTHKINVIDAPGYADFIGDVQVRAARGRCGHHRDRRLGRRRGRHRAGLAAAPKSAVSRACSSSTRWTARTPTSAGARLGPRRVRQCGGADPVPDRLREAASGASSICSPSKRHCYTDSRDGEFRVRSHPDELQTRTRRYRRQLVESIAEQDEELMMRYLEDEPIAMEELAAGLKQCVARRRRRPGARAGRRR